MSSKENINKLALEIVDYLNELIGFDDWWESLDSDEQIEITRIIGQHIEDAVDFL